MANNVTVPKKTTVAGMPHNLAYITPQEANLLKSLGGTGQLHKGIPSYPPAGDAGGTGSGQSGTSSGVGGFGAGSPSAQAAAAAQGFQAAMAAEAQAQANAAAQAAAIQQMQEQEMNARLAMQQQMVQEGRFKSAPNITGSNVHQYVTDEFGNVVGAVHDATFMSPFMAIASELTGITPTVYSGRTGYSPIGTAPPDIGVGGRPERVPPVQDPLTGEARCPTGYVFNETLQACIMDTAATSSFQPTAPVAPTVPSGDYYARTGLLDQPPAGLLEAGFGKPQDFAAANTAFRMGAATRPSMYTDPYSMKGYTLLS